MSEINIPLKHNNAPIKEGYYYIEIYPGQWPSFVRVFVFQGKFWFFESNYYKVSDWATFRWSDTITFS
jgi:hypothetical protein